MDTEKKCKNCGKWQVYYNPYNDVVQCHACGHQLGAPTTGVPMEEEK